MTNQDNHSIELEPIDCKHKKGINGSGNCKSCGEFLKATPYQPMDIPPPPEVTGQLATDEQQDTKPVKIAPTPQPEQHTTDIQEILEILVLNRIEPKSLSIADVKACETVTQTIEALINHKVEEATVYFRADIAHAIGYCQGLGHPDKYLEKRYPDIKALKEQGDTE